MRGQLTTGARAGATSLAALATAALLGLAAAPAAFAHNVLTGSSPEDGATLDTAPDEVVLTFNEEVLEGGNAIVVTGPDGDNHTAGEVGIDDREATIDLTPLDKAGDYDIQYRIVSADGHIVEGTLAFAVTDDAVADAAPDDEDAAEGDAAEAEEPADVEPSPAANEDNADAALGGMDTWVAIIVALGVVGAIVIILLRLRRGGPGGTP